MSEMNNKIKTELEIKENTKKQEELKKMLTSKKIIVKMSRDKLEKIINEYDEEYNIEYIPKEEAIEEIRRRIDKYDNMLFEIMDKIPNYDDEEEDIDDAEKRCYEMIDQVIDYDICVNGIRYNREKLYKVVEELAERERKLIY